MLKRLCLHNFKSYLNAEFEFSLRHLVIGKNNAGKTNLRSALHFLSAAAQMDLTSAAAAWIPGGIDAMPNYALRAKSRTVDFEVECELKFRDEILTYRYALSLQAEASLSGGAPDAQSLNVRNERLAVTGGKFKDTVLLDNDGREAVLFHEEQVGEPSPYTPKTLAPVGATMLSKLYELETNRRAIHFRRFLASWAGYSLCAHAIRFGWRKPNQPAVLWESGDNLATAIFHLKNQEERRYRRFLERVRMVEDGLDAVNFIVSPEQGIVPFVSLPDAPRASWTSLSDGTLKVMALAFLIEQADMAANISDRSIPFMLIEEPENGLYGGLLRKLLEEFDNCAPTAQIIFTSHSPFFIDLFDARPGAVILLRRERERTVIQKLAADKALVPPEERLTLADRYFSEILG